MKGGGPQDSSTALIQRVRLELALPALMLVVLAFGLYVARRYEHAVERAVISAYQETQLEIVRAVARSAEVYLADELARGTDRNTIEQTILKRFVEPVKLLRSGDAWIYAPDHVVFDLSADFPEEYKGKSMAQIFEIQRQHGAAHYEEMSWAVQQSREGVGWYVWLPSKGREIAAWAPVRLRDHVWTIGLSTPLREIMAATGARAQARVIWLGLAVATVLGLGLTAFATRSVLVRRRIAGAIAQSERKYRALFETSADGILLVSPDGVIADANPAACDIYGLRREELCRRRLAALLPTDYHAAMAQNLSTALEGKSFRCRLQALRSDGALLDIELSGSRLEVAERVCVLLNSRDLTERIAAEREKEELEARLARSKKMEALGLLAGGVAHDLNNILCGIVGYPEMLMSELRPPRGSRLAEMLETMEESGSRAAAVVSDLMTITKGASSPRSAVHLNQIIDDYLMFGEVRELKARFPTVRLETRLSDELPSIKASPVGIKQCVVNLVQNSAEAIKAEGVVRLATRQQRVTEPLVGYSTIPAGDYCVLTVADNGPGIPATDLERIFEPFFSRKQKGRSGTGLGLAIVWNAVQDAGGFIDVRSDGGGTTFELFFPVNREVEPARPSIPSREELTGHGEKILVVDDEPRQRAIACRMLETLGYQPDAVGSGEEAIEYLRTRGVDLVVLDMIMAPGMSGRQTYERIVKERPGQKAILVSGYADNAEVAAAQQLGVGECVKKPYTLEHLGKSVLLELRK